MIGVRISTKGIKTAGADNLQYGLDDEEPVGRVTRNLGVLSSVDDSGHARDPSFAVSAVKFIGESRHCLQTSRSAELAAARGSCGTNEVKA